MLRKLALGILLAVATFALSAATPNNNQDDPSNKNVSAEERMADYAFALDGLTGVLILATIGLGVVSSIGIRNQSRETRIIQRAYVAVRSLGINPFLSDKGTVPDQIVGHVAFVNVGRLPARNLSVERALIKWDASDELDETNLTVTQSPTMTIVLPPGTEMRHGTHPLPASELDKPGSIYVYGRIDYIDGFNVKRHTRFCHRYPCIRHKTSSERKSINQIDARYHQHGNDAD
jgi:hypothetical protein